jgi:hypothetical protein
MDDRTSHTFISVVVAAVTAGSPVSSAGAVVPCAIAIDMRAASPLERSDVADHSLRREATRVWASEGVRFCWTDEGACPPSMPLLYVRVVRDVPVAPDASPARTLGWMGFSERGGPGPLILLSQRWVADLLGRAERGARALADLPGMVRRLLPRALGRALSHELGHYLLGRREHSMSGVMRATFRPEDLADEGVGQRMGLSAGDRRALRTRCAEASVLARRTP